MIGKTVKDPIGILTASRKPDVLGGNVSNFRRIIQAAHKQDISCAIYNVCPREVTVYRYSQQGSLRKENFVGFPKVLYNRIPTRVLENQDVVKKTIHELERQGRKITNPHFLRKDEIATLWDSRTDLAECTPRSHVVRHEEDILHYASTGEYDGLYLKPISGKAGIGIFHIAKHGQHFEVLEQQKGRRVRHGLFTYKELSDWILKRRWGQHYLLQEEAAVEHYRGRRFDLRLLLHKDSNAPFALTGAGVRIGPARGITTHVPNGGEIAKPQDVLKDLYGKRAEYVLQQASDVAVKAADAIATSPGIWSELSIDMGLMKDGSPVLFEANAKPMKFDEPSIEQLAKKRLIQCLLHLA